MKFVRDEPSAALVNHLAKVYRKHDTEIAPVLRALVGSREFQRSAGAKVRDPGEDIVASYRALGIRMDKPASDDAGVNALLWQAGSIGIYPLAWPRPDGQPIDNLSWSSPARLMASMSVHYTLERRLVADGRHALPQARRLAARSRGSGSPSSSTTSRESCCTGGRPTACCRPAATPPAASRRSGSTRSTSSCSGACPAC